MYIWTRIEQMRVLVFHLLFCSSAVELDLDAVEVVADFLLYARMQAHLDVIQ